MTVFMAFWLGLVRGLDRVFPRKQLGTPCAPAAFFRHSRTAACLRRDGAFGHCPQLWWSLPGRKSEAFCRPLRRFQGFCSAESWRKLSGKIRACALAALIIFGSIPAGAVGLLFEEQLSALFAKPVLVSLLLFVTGFILLASDKAAGRKKLDQMSFANSFFVGLAPGCSNSARHLPLRFHNRSRLKAGLSRETAAKFSFLLSLPAILRGGLLQLGDISGGAVSSGAMIVGFLTAALSGYFAIRFLVRLLQAGRLRSFLPITALQ